MSAVLKNTLISGLAVLMIVGAFTLLQEQDRRIVIAEAQDLHLSELLENPMKYNSLDVSVAGVLLWHPDEPTLFTDDRTRKNQDFSNAIRLETRNVDFQFANEASVIASGVFFFDPEFARRFKGHKGIFRVESIIVVDKDLRY